MGGRDCDTRGGVGEGGYSTEGRLPRVFVCESEREKERDVKDKQGKR